MPRKFPGKKDYVKKTQKYNFQHPVAQTFLAEAKARKTFFDQIQEIENRHMTEEKTQGNQPSTSGAPQPNETPKQQPHLFRKHGKTYLSIPLNQVPNCGHHEELRNLPPNTVLEPNPDDVYTTTMTPTQYLKEVDEGRIPKTPKYHQIKELAKIPGANSDAKIVVSSFKVTELHKHT